MKQVRIKCVDCGRSVIVSVLQPCYYCGRAYKEPELDEMLAGSKAEEVEVEKLLSAQGPVLLPATSPARTPTWLKLLYVAAILFFLVFCMACALLIVRFSR